MISRTLLSILSSVAVVSINVNAANFTGNWPQWRGPLGTGVAPEAKPPLKWSEDSGVKWKVKLPGHGASTPIVWNDQIFIQAAIPTGKKVASIPAEIASPVPAAQQQGGERERRRGGGGRPGGQTPTEEHQFVLLSIDRATGKINWQKVVREELPHEGHHQDHGYSSSSPVTDGQTVVAYFGSRGLHAFDLKGNLKWSKDLGKMRTRMSFGEGNSPALHGDTVVVTWDHEGEDFIAAFDKNSGKELWRQNREEITAWSTPLIIEQNGKAQVIASATRKIRSYDLESGKLIWECGGMTENVVPTPVADQEKVYATSGFRGNALLAIKLGHTGDLTGTDAIAWKHDRGTPYVPSPLLYKDRLYFFSGNNGMISSFDTKTGKPLFEVERLENFQQVYASPVAANNRIYLVSRNGTTLVLNPSDKVEVLATNKLDENFEASPALVGNQIFLRGRQHLYCLAD
jgi:outer membrane protein assembly factor BamB